MKIINPMQQRIPILIMIFLIRKNSKY